MLQTLQITVPIFILIGIGYALRATRIAKKEWVSVLNGFVYYVSLPALIVTNFAKLDWNNRAVTQTVVGNCALLFASACVAYSITKLMRHKTQHEKAAFFMTASISNSIYLGIPLSVSAFKNVNTELITASAVIQLVGGMLVALVCIEYIYLKTRSFRSIAKHLGKNPLFLSICAGLLLSLFTLPSWLQSSVDTPLKMIAATASPVALIALGSFLYGHQLRKNKGLLMLTIGTKLALLPFVAYVVTRLLHTEQSLQHTVIFMSAMPTAVTAFVLSKSYRLDLTYVASSMFATTVVGALSLPLLLLVLS
jgi:hypothetical protein